jgi:hypothetical protein
MKAIGEHMRIIIITTKLRSRLITSLINQPVKVYPLLTPTLEEETYSCKSIKCTKMTAITRRGSRKCNMKKRLKQAVPNEKPPQIMMTNSLPYGKTPAKEVMTVAPQNDICPQGKTYLRKDALMVKINRIKPLFQRLLLELLENHNPLPRCTIIAKNTPEQKLACTKRIIPPPINVSIIYSTLSNA